MNKKYFFTSESVSEGHPDKVADQISDAALDYFLKIDPNSKVACETLVTTDFVLCAGETRTKFISSLPQYIVRNTIRNIGYITKEIGFNSDTCEIVNKLHGQSDDIYQGVDKSLPEMQGAGDQGIMFGYAVNESPNYMPLTIELSHLLLKELANIRKEKRIMKYLRPDAKSQVTIEYHENFPIKIDTIVISTQHDESVIVDEIKDDILEHLIPRVKNNLPPEVIKLFDGGFNLLVNPTGKFVIGGPNGDTGLTGRKIIVDTYGGRGSHGGGAFSGKDSSKVDRSAAYAARHMAKNTVAAGIANEILIQLSYAIGVAEPVALYVNTFGTGKFSDEIIAEVLKKVFDLKPYSIIERLGLKNPIYQKTAAYGHFGRESYKEDIEVFYEDNTTYKRDGKTFKSIEYFSWEKLDYIDVLLEEFSMQRLKQYKEKFNEGV